MPHILEDFCQFLALAPTSFHAAHEVGNRFASLDMIPLDEGEKWQLEKKKKYFVSRGGSILAFSLPEKAPTKMTISAAHTDSPALKLKPHPEIAKDSLHLLGTEIYGGPILSSWFNRDLAIAGRIVVDAEEEKLVFLDENPVFIPQLSLHLDREVNEKGVHIDKQDHLRPIFSLDTKETLTSLLQKQVSFKELLSFDLYLVPLEEPRFLGIGDELLAAYRLDNLASSHASITAFALAPPSDALQLCVLWDAEEIGSRTSDGAASPFVQDTLKRIAAFYQMSDEDFIRMKSQSLCVSVDVAHAYNPNFPKKYDPEHAPMAGKGIVIKYNADKRYVTDATTAAPIISTCKKLKLPYQSYASHSNIPSGSTIGPIFAHTMGIPTVDIGAAIFSMHSTREVMATKDHLDMCHLLQALYTR